MSRAGAASGPGVTAIAGPASNAQAQSGWEFALVITYEVQGRRREGGNGDKFQEVVRLDSADSPAAAFTIAETMAADGLKVWVFEAHHRSTLSPTYKLLGVVPATTR
jgi:hypothetical protein